MFKIVNGFACMSGCDVAAAKKGKDPENPNGDPVKEAQLKEAEALARGQDPDQVDLKPNERVAGAEEASASGRDSRRRGGDPGPGLGLLFDSYA